MLRPWARGQCGCRGVHGVRSPARRACTYPAHLRPAGLPQRCCSGEANPGTRSVPFNRRFLGPAGAGRRCRAAGSGHRRGHGGSPGAVPAPRARRYRPRLLNSAGDEGVVGCPTAQLLDDVRWRAARCGDCTAFWPGLVWPGRGPGRQCSFACRRSTHRWDGSLATTARGPAPGVNGRPTAATTGPDRRKRQLLRGAGLECGTTHTPALSL